MNQFKSFVQQPSTRLYFENPAGRVLEHPDGYAVFQYFPGERKLTDLQALLTHTGLLLKRHNWNQLLGDHRVMSHHTPAESEWIVEYWLDSSRYGEDGIYGAILLAQHEFAQVPADQADQELKAEALTYRLFDKEENAVAWLKQASR